MNAKSAAPSSDPHKGIVAYFAHLGPSRVHLFKRKQGGTMSTVDPPFDNGMRNKQVYPREGGTDSFCSPAPRHPYVVSSSIALIVFGFGAVIAAVYDNLPFLTFLGLHKEWIFALTAPN